MNGLELIDPRLISQEKVCNTSGSRGTIPRPPAEQGLLAVGFKENRPFIQNSQCRLKSSSGLEGLQLCA